MPKPFNAKLGERIRKARISAGVLQKDLSKQCRISPGLLCQIEKGVTSVTVQNLLAICKKLSITPNDLLL